MASASTKNHSGGKFPEGFVSPFKRVPMEERNDDALACIATVANKSLADVTRIAIDLGYPPFGPAFVDNKLITRLLAKLGLIGGEYAELPSIAALPDVAILMVDYVDESDMGRHVVWHHVLTLPLFRVVLSPMVTRLFYAVPRTSVARTASG